MNLINYGNRSTRSCYHRAVAGAYFGIINTFIVFIPILFSLWGQWIFFGINAAIATVMVTTLLVISIYYKPKIRYTTGELRYLMLVGIMEIVFYLGYATILYISMGVSLLSLNMLMLIAYVILSLLSGTYILIQSYEGLKQYNRIYTRTHHKRTFMNVLALLLGAVMALVFLAPHILLLFWK